MNNRESKADPREAYPPAPCSAHYALFEHMSNEHGLTLLDSELTEIVRIARTQTMRLSSLTDALIRHGVIQADAIEDAEGYDEGRTRDAVLKVYEDITGMVTPNIGVRVAGHGVPSRPGSQSESMEE